MIDEFQKESAKLFKQHTPLDEEQARMLDWCTGLSGETGEVAELIKHATFSNAKLDKMALAKELGDVMWYLAAIATTADMTLSDILSLNVAKLQSRYALAQYSDEASANRKVTEQDFKSSPAYQVLQARLLKHAAPCNVILIGPDGSGKTTIAKKLAEALGFKYHKCDYQQDDKINLARHLLNTQINVVYDRFYCPDDVIYNSVKDIEMSEETLNGWDEIQALMDKRNCIIIYVTASFNVLQSRSAVWIDDYVQVKHLDAIVNAYEAWLAFSRKMHPYLGYAVIDTSVTDVFEVSKIVTSIVQVVQMSQERFGNFELEDETNG